MTGLIRVPPIEMVMVAEVPLSLLAYGAPIVFGLATYLRLFHRRNVVEGAAFAWGLGWILVNTLLLTTNQILFVDFAAGWLLPAAVSLLIASLLLIPWPRDLRAGLSRLATWGFGRLRSTGPWGILLVGPAILLALVLAKGVIYPETGPDSIFYHLYLPKLAFLQGFLPRTAGLGMLQWPNAYPNLLVTQQVWIYYIAGSANQLLSRPVVPLYALLTAGLLVHMGERRKRGLGALALLLWASFEIPGSVVPELLAPQFLAFGRLSIEIFSDVPVTFYALLALHFVLDGSRSGHPRLLGAGGTFAAGAALTKYNGFLFVAFLSLALLVLLLRLPREEELLDRRQHALAGFFAPLLLTVPLLLRNLLLFGNPVYPILTGLFGGVGVDAVPFLVAYEPPASLTVKVQQATVLLGSFLFLLFVASLSRGGREARLLQVVAGGYITTLLLLFSFQSAFYRLALPAFPAVALSAGAWLRQILFETRNPASLGLVVAAGGVSTAVLPNPHLPVALVFLVLAALLTAKRGVLARLVPKERNWLLATVFLVLSLSLVHPSVQVAALTKYPTPTLGPLPTGLPRVPDEQVLLREYGDRWLMWKWMNENLPSGAKVLALDVGRYYVDAEIVGPTDPRVVAHYQVESLDEAVGILRGAGVGYVFKDLFFPGYVVTRPFWQASPVFQNLHDQTHFQLLHEESGLELYRIRG